MGLDISHDAFSGAYSAFDRFRRAIVEGPMRGKWGGVNDGTWFYDESTGFSPETHRALWVLINHSDCGGVINVELLLDLADQLEAIAPSLSAGGIGHLVRMGGPRGAALSIAAGARRAHAAGEPLVFH